MSREREIAIRAFSAAGTEILKGIIPDEKGAHPVSGYTVEVKKRRTKGRGPNGKPKGVQLRIRELSPGWTKVKVGSTQETTSPAKLPKSEVRVQAKLVNK